MSKLIKVVHKKIGERPTVVEIKCDDLPAMQRLVGGYIEMVQWEPFLLVVNENGLYENPPRPNLRFEQAGANLVNKSVYGDVFVTAQKGTNMRTLTPTEITKAIALLEEFAISYRGQAK